MGMALDCGDGDDEERKIMALGRCSITAPSVLVAFRDLVSPLVSSACPACYTCCTYRGSRSTRVEDGPHWSLRRCRQDMSLSRWETGRWMWKPQPPTRRWAVHRPHAVRAVGPATRDAWIGRRTRYTPLHIPTDNGGELWHGISQRRSRFHSSKRSDMELPRYRTARIHHHGQCQRMS